MKSFEQYVNEAKSGTVEIPTTNADSLKSKIEKAGGTVTKSDDEGLVVKYTDDSKIKRVLLSNGWDKEDVKSLF